MQRNLIGLAAILAGLVAAFLMGMEVKGHGTTEIVCAIGGLANIGAVVWVIIGLTAAPRIEPRAKTTA